MFKKLARTINIGIVITLLQTWRDGHRACHFATYGRCKLRHVCYYGRKADENMSMVENMYMFEELCTR